MEPSGDSGGGHGGGTPFVVVLDGVSPGQRALGVVQVDDALEFSVGLAIPQPPPHDIYQALAKLRLVHSTAASPS